MPLRDAWTRLKGTLDAFGLSASFHLDNQQVGFAERLNTTKSYYLDLMLLLVGLLALAAAVVIVKQQCCPRESHQAHGHENEIQSPLMAEQPQESSGTK